MEGVIGYVTPFAGNFAPYGWALCWGQPMPINQNTALFATISTTYGGSGNNFNLPDLRGRAVVGPGTATGLSVYTVGQDGGTQSFVMSPAQMPAHSHVISVDVVPSASSAYDSNTPVGNLYASPSTGDSLYSTDNTSNMQPYPGTVAMGNMGSGSQVASQDPLMAMTYIICVYGDFPARQ